MALDLRHMETVARILEAVATVTDESARGVLACEDAAIALIGGVPLGLTSKQVAAQFDILMAEMVGARVDVAH